MEKKNKKPKDKQRAKLKAKREVEKIKNNSILYICSECNGEEMIPKSVVMEFDIMDDGDISEPPRFTFEKCNVLCILRTMS